jgi:hypothetical protein
MREQRRGRGKDKKKKRKEERTWGIAFCETNFWMQVTEIKAAL